MNLKKMERYLRVNLLGPGPRLMKKEFTEPRSHKGWGTLVHTIYFVRITEAVYAVSTQTFSNAIIRVSRLYQTNKQEQTGTEGKGYINLP